MSVTQSLGQVYLEQVTKSGTSIVLPELLLFFFEDRLVAISNGTEVLIRDDIILHGHTTRVLSLWHAGQSTRKVDPYTFADALVEGLRESANTLRTEILSNARS